MKQVKRQGVKPAVDNAARLCVRVSDEAQKRLFVTSLMAGETASDIVNRLILAHCREYSLPGKIVARNATHDRAIPSAEVRDSDAPLPLQDAA